MAIFNIGDMMRQKQAGIEEVKTSLKSGAFGTAAKPAEAEKKETVKAEKKPVTKKSSKKKA